MIPTLKDCVEYEEGPGIVNLADLKVRCFDFAIEITRGGLYNPTEVMKIAKQIFDWCIKNEKLNSEQNDERSVANGLHSSTNDDKQKN